MLRLNSLSASGMRYGSLRKKRLACSRVSQPLEMAACAASCALVTRSAIICFPFVWGNGCVLALYANFIVVGVWDREILVGVVVEFG